MIVNTNVCYPYGEVEELCKRIVFYSPDNLKPSLKIIQSGEVKTIELSCDSHFKKSICQFYNAINDTAVREKIYNEILLQAQLVQKVRDISGGIGNDKI